MEPKWLVEEHMLSTYPRYRESLYDTIERFYSDYAKIERQFLDEKQKHGMVKIQDFDLYLKTAVTNEA